jgi:FKBP12-rapamycin complex-associated protein
MVSPEAPSELVLTLLNLAEFMEHEEKSLPFEARVLGEYSAKFNAWAKALHYRELEYFQDASLPVMEALIGINTKLQQQDSAWGVLITAREQYNTSGHEEWYEKLGRWHNALGLYQEKLEQDPNRQDAIIGRMRCLHALGEWDQLSLDIGDYWDMVGNDERREMAPMAAAAAWSLNDWHIMKKFVEHMSDDLADKAFYNAIYQVHDNNFIKAHASIDRARDLLEPDMVAVVGEGYGRSYK